MARNLENSTSENSNVQEMGLLRSVRLNATISGAAPPPRVSTMGTTTVATSVATRGEVHGAFITARAVPSKAVATRGEVHGAFITARAGPSKAHGTKAIIQVVPSKFAQARAQASHSHASHTKQPAPTKQPAIAAQPAPAKQPALVTQPAPDEQPTPDEPTLTAQPAPAEQPALMTQPAPDKQPTPVA
ncbi:hypothetical protein ACFXTH_025320 [Malus domestica]